MFVGEGGVGWGGGEGGLGVAPSHPPTPFRRLWNIVTHEARICSLRAPVSLGLCFCDCSYRVLSLPFFAMASAYVILFIVICSQIFTLRILSISFLDSFFLSVILPPSVHLLLKTKISHSGPEKIDTKIYTFKE